MCSIMAGNTSWTHFQETTRAKLDVCFFWKRVPCSLPISKWPGSNCMQDHTFGITHPCCFRVLLIRSYTPHYTLSYTALEWINNSIKNYRSLPGKSREQVKVGKLGGTEESLFPLMPIDRNCLMAKKINCIVLLIDRQFLDIWALSSLNNSTGDPEVARLLNNSSINL